jgi:hypothetical protein
VSALKSVTVNATFVTCRDCDVGPIPFSFVRFVGTVVHFAQKYGHHKLTKATHDVRRIYNTGFASP